MVTNHISGMAEARVIKFCTLVGYMKSQHTDDKTTLKRGVVRVTSPVFLNFAPIISLESVKLGTSNFVCTATAEGPRDALC